MFYQEITEPIVLEISAAFDNETLNYTDMRRHLQCEPKLNLKEDIEGF